MLIIPLKKNAVGLYLNISKTEEEEDPESLKQHKYKYSKPRIIHWKAPDTNCVIISIIEKKLDGVGLVDNRPSTD